MLEKRWHNSVVEHSSQKVLNALILLKCDEGRFHGSNS